MFTNLPTPPPQPPWEGMHPLVVHFPIALLLFAAVFIVLAMIVPKRGWWFSVSALILLIGGTAGAFVAVSTGIAARDVVEDAEDDAMWDVMQEHEDMMEQARNVFVALTVIYAGIVILPLLAKSLQSLKFAFPVNLVFLAALMGANLYLASGAHLGGRLVHQYGVRSALAPEDGAAASAAEEGASETESEAEAPAAEDAQDAPAPDAQMEPPAAEDVQTTPAPEAEKEPPAEESKPAAPAAEAKPDAPAPDAKPEASAAEPKPADDASKAKPDAPAPDPAKDGANR